MIAVRDPRVSRSKWPTHAVRHWWRRLGDDAAQKTSATMFGTLGRSRDRECSPARRCSQPPTCSADGGYCGARRSRRGRSTCWMLLCAGVARRRTWPAERGLGSAGSRTMLSEQATSVAIQRWRDGRPRRVGCGVAYYLAQGSSLWMTSLAASTPSHGRPGACCPTTCRPVRACRCVLLVATLLAVPSSAPGDVSAVSWRRAAPRFARRAPGSWSIMRASVADRRRHGRRPPGEGTAASVASRTRGARQPC